MKAGLFQTEIAKVMGVHKSIISREMHRNRGHQGYRYKQAQCFAMKRREQAVSISFHRTLVEYFLRENWNLEQISRWLNYEFKMMVSHESIYQFISLFLNINSKEAISTCIFDVKNNAGNVMVRQITEVEFLIEYQLTNALPLLMSAHELVIGSLIQLIGKGHKQAIVSLTERKLRLTLIAKVKRKSSELVSLSIQHLLMPPASKVFTLTSDNAKEFARHQKIATALQTDFYFAHPYSSWEWGLNENTNGLIRQYFPKKHDFTYITEKAICMVMNKLNNRSRKCLGFKTPNQVFFGIKPSVALRT